MYPIAVVATVLLVWYVVSIVADSEFILPAPFATLRRLIALLGETAFWSAFGYTLLRSILAYVISVIGSLCLALLSYFFKPIGRFLSPLVSILRALPTMAVVLLIVVWAGAKKAPVIVALMVLLPTLYATTIEALDNIDRDILNMARIDGANRLTLTIKFLLPLSAPLVSRSVSAGIALGIKLIVAAEVLASTANSVGMMMQLSRIYFEVAELIALTVVTVITALILEKLVYVLLSLSFKNWK